MSHATESPNRYPEDFFIKALRNYRKPNPSMVRKMLAGRAQYLEGKAKDFAEQGRPIGMFIDELRAIADVIEVYEATHPLPDATAMSFQQRFEIPPYTPERPPSTAGQTRYPVKEKS
jgi:hypothetical protein